jgi:hypothetical protein
MNRLNIAIFTLGLAISDFSGAQEATAQLTVTNSTNARIAAHYFKNSDDCSGGRTSFLPEAVFTPGQSVTVSIDANKDLSMFMTTLDKWNVNIGGVTQVKSCMVPFTFTPKPGEKYTAQFSATKSEDACKVQLEVVTDQGPKAEDSYRSRQWRRAWSESGSFCKPLS